MFIKLSTLLIIFQIFFAQGEKLDWELAVVVANEFQLLSLNGSVLKTQTRPFSSLKALVYDGVRDQFLVSDTDATNDTIYTVQISEERDITSPIIQNLPGDVQGLAIDSSKDVLYWADVMNQTINYVSLNDAKLAGTLMMFDDKKPHAIAIDVCNRYIYYTNPSGKKPTIERMRLDKTGHEILVANIIMSPVGLAIDYLDQRLYWADSRIGTTSGKIESISLDGKDRRMVIEKYSMEPYGLAVDEHAIYWTDTLNKVLYKLPKYDPKAEPVRLVEFEESPMGLATNNSPLKNHCELLATSRKEYQQEVSSTNPPFEKAALGCLNAGNATKTGCICKRGFRGRYCEISLCNDDYCLNNGNCYLSSSGQPLCDDCDDGFFGARCEKNKCDGYCLNRGECVNGPSSTSPKCDCPEGFIGKRCEYRTQMCDVFCKDVERGVGSEELEIVCGCNNQERNASLGVQSALSTKENILSKLQDPVVYLSALLFSCLLTIIAMFVYIRLVQKRRPRIKKRIIVSKNVTPLTYRPQPNTEQCEITIENCCNMNICETPCFEPTGADKKKLLSDMDGEDLY